jgi:hypothetical protein
MVAVGLKAPIPPDADIEGKVPGLMEAELPPRRMIAT